MPDFEIRGADQLYRLSKALKAAGQTELRKELNKGVKTAAKSLIADTRAAAKRDLPKRGGLNIRMAKAPQRIRIRTGKDPGVSVVVPKKQPGYNEGIIRHPVFGKKTPGEKSKAKWVTQRIDGEWFDGTIRKGTHRVAPEMERALERVAEEIVRKAGR